MRKSVPTSVARGALHRGFYVVLLLLILFYALSSRHFLTVANIKNILTDSSSLMILCAGLSFVVIMGNLDLSIGSCAFLTSTLTVLLMKHGHPLVVCLLLAGAIGLMVGAINGALVAFLGLNSMLVTLGTMMSLRGIGMLISRGMVISVPSALKKQLIVHIGPIPLIVLVAIGVLVLCQVLLSASRFGRHVVAVGCSESAARRVGLRVAAVRFSAFVLCGFLAAIGGVVVMVNVGALTPTLGSGAEFLAVAAIVMGGTSLFGGQGSIIPGAMAGALMLVVIENGLAIMSVSPFVYPMIRGLVIFVAMYADSWKNRNVGKLALE